MNISVKKLTALTAAVCTLFLSACKSEEDLPENVTAVPTETTPLTLTVALTEEKPLIPEPEEEDEEKRIELAVYDPFSDSVKVEENIYEELRQAVIEISDAWAFFAANSTGFPTSSEYYTNYADRDNILEENKEEEYSFAPLNPKYASTEEELFERFRRIYTENYMSDEEIRENLFEPRIYFGHYNPPIYKTIDGVLCMELAYMGLRTAILTDEICVLSYNENSAHILAYGENWASDDGTIFYIDLKKSTDGVWQLDKISPRDRDVFTTTPLYEMIYNNSEKLNKILGGGTVPENPEIIEIDGISYIETDLDMGIEDMYDCFGEILFADEMKYRTDIDEFINFSLADEYRRKYIDEVYYEQDGKLFRRADAPEWYFPEIEIDPHTQRGDVLDDIEDIESFDEYGRFYLFSWRFSDESGKKVMEDAVMHYNGIYRADEDDEVYLHIASGLPILERTK